MKRITLLVLSCLFVSIGMAQNVNTITSELENILKQKSDELVDVNIYFKSQMPTEHLTHLNVKSDSKGIRREIVINELKKFSQQQQESVMSVINAETRSNNITDVTSHWIVNSINCKASRDVIYTLASHPDIKYIDYNKEEMMFQGEDQEFEGQDVRGSVSSMSDNITHVQADKVWDLGYTGKGVIVAVIDSGINTDHVDLKDHLWYDEGAQYPGYNFVFPGQNPTDDNGHGTHCSGTVCGDGTSGLTTGMAPDATLMPLKITNRSTGIGAGMDRVIDAIEYAADNGADIISISIGWWATSAANRQTFRQAFENTLQAGIVVAAAAGNNRESLATYPAPNNINSPADCPPPYLHSDQTIQGGLTSVISVGAVDENNVIAGISSQGPVTWANTTYGDYPYNPGIGLIRPDIVAPGASVKSLAYDSNIGYAIKAGTSMAAPCVAGVMALMLEKNPELTPADLCRIIETTATKLTQTKSNDYGSGCINALAAVRAIDFDVEAPYLSPYSFNNNVTTGTNQNIELTLINNGKESTSGMTNVTITTDDEYVSIVSGDASCGVMAHNGTASVSFTINVNTLVVDNHEFILNVNATNGNDSWNFDMEMKVTNPFFPPNNVSASVSGTTVLLSWSETNNATSYNIYRDGSYIANTEATSYTDESLEYGTVYEYTITSKRGELETEHSREIRVQTGDNPEAPSPTNIVATDNNSSVAISWNNSTGSKGSNIYRKDNIAGSETQIASNVSGNSYTDNISLQEGIYQYGVTNLHSEKETIYEEGFEDNGTSLPNGWSVYRVEANQYNWGVKESETQNSTTFTPYMGKYAAFSFLGAYNYTKKYYLVTSSFDLSEYQGSDVTLSFYYITPAWGTDVNNLNVRIGSSPTGPWNDAIWTSNKTNVTQWTKAEVDLTSYIGSTFYITFENEIGYGLCSAVDNVSITIDGNKESRIEWSDNIYKNVNIFEKDGVWNNSSNWVTNNIPNANDSHVIINANAIIDGTVEVNSLTINEGKTLTLNEGAILTVNANFNNTDPDALIINDGAQIIQNNEDVAATFNMNIVNPSEWSSNNKTGWQFISSPIKDAKINDFIPESSDYDLYRYDGTKNFEWINHKDENDYEEEPETPVISIDTVTIGEGNYSKAFYAPISNYGSAKYSYSQQIYLKEEIGKDNGTITSIAFHNVNGGPNNRNIIVYMSNVEKSSYSNSEDYVNVTNADIVYQGNHTFGSAEEWTTIELQTPFVYTGKNIAITVNDLTGTDKQYSGYDQFYSTITTEYRGIYGTSPTSFDCSDLGSKFLYILKSGAYSTPANTPYVADLRLTIKSATREVSSVSPSRSSFESTFVQGAGYLASYEIEKASVFKGNLNHEQHYEFPVSYDSEKDLANFHLLGNPFSFNMKWNKVTTNKLASGYAIVNETGGYTYLGSADDEIAVGDGFFVKATGENPSISYNEGQSRRKVEDKSIDVVITGNAGSDNVVIKLDYADEEGFPKLKNFNEDITTIFVYKDEKSYGIYNCEEDDEEVPIHLNNTNGIGKYTISIDAKGDFENITLVDLMSGDETNMLVHDYNFTAPQQENTKRFILKFVEKQQTTDNRHFVYQSGEELIVNTQGTVQIIDIVGRVVYNDVVLNESERINISGLNTGTYIVRVIGDKDVMTQKVVVY